MSAVTSGTSGNSGSPILEVRLDRVSWITEEFGTNHVLRDISFSVQAGEIVSLIGPSGCGKSTLLRLITKIGTNFEGSISTRARRISAIFQTPRLLPWRSLADNISIVIPQRTQPGKVAEDLLEQVGMADLGAAFPERISLGMQRRVALARALATEPDLIIMDEPLVSLDQYSREDLQSLIRTALTRRNTAALIATHDTLEAVALSDRLIELSGSPATIVRNERSPLSDIERENPLCRQEVHRTWWAGS